MNWLEFFEANDVEYVTRSSNTRAGEVSISCPFCGADDPSHHMGVSLTEQKWGCWRDATHRGKKASRLIRALLGCSREMAETLEKQYSVPDPENLDEAIALLQGFTVEQPLLAPTTLQFPPEFKDIKAMSSYYYYLKNRGVRHIEAFCEHYDLKCCDLGLWHRRLIFPITDGGKLVSWTGRAIGTVINAARYRILPMKEGALVDRNGMIFNEKNLTGAKFLFVTEGPIDALKLDWYGVGVANATCIFGTYLSSQQAAMLGRIRQRYERAILLLDANATAAALRANDMLAHYGFEEGELPAGYDDPGEMDWRTIETYLEGLG